MMINCKKCLSVVFVSFGLCVNVYSIDFLDAAKSLGGLDKIKEKLSKEISSGKSSLGGYANKALGDALGGFDLSGLLSGNSEAFQSDLDNGVTNVVTKSLDYSKGLRSPELPSVVQSLTPFIKDTINSSISSLNMGETASSLFKSEFFQENIIGFVSKFVSGNMEKGISPVVNSDLVQSLSQDFYKSPAFLETIASFAQNSLMGEDDVTKESRQKLQQNEILQQIQNIKTTNEVKQVEDVVVLKKVQPQVKVEPVQEKQEPVGWMDYIKGMLGF